MRRGSHLIRSGGSGQPQAETVQPRDESLVLGPIGPRGVGRCVSQRHSATAKTRAEDGWHSIRKRCRNDGALVGAHCEASREFGQSEVAASRFPKNSEHGRIQIIIFQMPF